MTTEQWRSRIVRHADADPTELKANPQNWRTHPPAQREALAQTLDEVGWVQDIVVNETTGHVVDRHLRIELAIERGEPTVPVVYVELTVEEERLVLATLDPLASMAEPDTAILSALLDDILMPEGALSDLLASLADRVAEVPFPALPEGGPEYHTLSFNVTALQRTLIETALTAAHSETPGEGNRNAEALALICERFTQ